MISTVRSFPCRHERAPSFADNCCLQLCTPQLDTLHACRIEDSNALVMSADQKVDPHQPEAVTSSPKLSKSQLKKQRKVQEELKKREQRAQVRNACLHTLVVHQLLRYTPKQFCMLLFIDCMAAFSVAGPVYTLP